MIGKKINQLATELAPVSTDLTIIGDPISGVSKKITLAQLGSIFSGAVSFYDNFASFPVTGDINVIYCAKDTKKLYLWSGSAYVEVFPSQALLDTYQLRSEKGNANGYASLDSSGKVPISQLPSSIMEYKGTWSAATNTPTLANGTGDTGDVYLCNAAGTVNFGAGPLTFAVGDYVVYSGTIWQRSSGAVGTVTSVAVSRSGDALTITGSPVTTSGTINIGFAGTSAEYINGAGSLTTFPTSLISGTGNVNAIPKFTANTVLGNSVMEDDGNFVSMRGLKLNTIAGTGNTINFQQGSGIIAAGLGYSSIGAAGSTGIQFYLDQNVTERIFVLDTTTITSNTARTYSMPNSNGTLALTSDIPSLTGYVPYTGATTNVNLGTHSLSAYDLIIDHTSGSGVAAYITKGGSGEALTVVKSSGSGNAASITGGVTLLSELHLTTDLADAYIASATNWNTAYNSRIASVVGPITFSLNTLGITQATGSSNGYLSSADWTTFNNKQSALTNPVTGTGTTNYLPKFTGTSTIGNSVIQESSIFIGIGMTPVSGYKLNVSGLQRNEGANTTLNFGELDANNIYFQALNLAGNASKGFIWYGTSEYMRLNASGNLGLGTTNPLAKLEVVNSAGSQLLIGYGGAADNYYDATNHIFRSASGAANRFTIASTGAATFSSSVTAATLNIESSAASLAAFNSTDTNGGYIRFKRSGTDFGFIGSAYHLFFGSQSNNDLGIRSDGNLIISSGGAGEKMRLTSAGSLGIGTTSPATTLHVAQDNGAITLTRAAGTYGTKIVQSNSDGSINFQIGLATAGSWRTYMRLGEGESDPSLLLQPYGGKVGIGTTSPSYALDVYRDTSTASYVVGRNGSGVQTAIGVAGDNGSLLGTLSNHNLRIVTNGAVVATFKTTGVLNLANVPTSSAGLSSGDIYKSAGVLMIV